MYITQVRRRTTSIYFLICFIQLVDVGLTVNLPCVPMMESVGYVCVCNSTYCDTIERPTELTAGSYYLYTTSETSPGFTVNTGTFNSDVSSTSKVYVTVNSSTYQTFKGVGGGFSDSSSYIFSLLPEGSQKNVLASLFGEESVELSFGRIPLGDTDFSLNYYSYDDVVDDVNMTYFNLTEFELTTKIPFIKGALKATSRTLNLLATAWTSPSWMKDNNDTMPGFVIPSYDEAWTKYMIKFFDQYKENGIEFWGIAPLNEVISAVNFDFSMPNVVMFPNQLRSWIRDFLGPMLEDTGYGDLVILPFDDERPFLAWYADRLLTDNETSQYIDGFAIHWYSDSDTNAYMLDDFISLYPDKFLLYTESSTADLGNSNSDNINSGNWEVAVKYLSNIIQNYQHWSQGYMCWNLLLNLEGGPYQQFSQTAPILANTSSGEFYKQPMHYVLGHFSKFIYPGSVRVGLTIEDDSSSEALEVMGLASSNAPGTGNPQPPTGGGGSVTGNPEPNPSGGSSGVPTSSPTSTTVVGVATTNPDGSKTVILFNPSSEEVTIVLTDTEVAGYISANVQANSLNTFIYWNGTSASTSGTSSFTAMEKISYVAMIGIFLSSYCLQSM